VYLTFETIIADRVCASEGVDASRSASLAPEVRDGLTLTRASNQLDFNRDIQR
jgi:hypothetical protein